MIYIIKTIGVLLAVIGVVYSTMPALMTRTMEFVKVGKRIYVVGGIRIVVGGLLLWACRSATFMWIPFAFAILILVSGILIFALGMERLQAWMGWWERQSETVRRAGAIVTAVIGVLLIYAA